MDTRAERQTHPLVIIASILVILFCGAGIAAIFGWIPRIRADQPTQLPPTAAIAQPAALPKAEEAKPERKAAADVKPVVTEPQKAAAKSHTRARPRPVPEQVAKAEQAPAPVTVPASVQQLPAQAAQIPPPPPQAPVKAICPNCGSIETVREAEKAGEATGIGAVGGAVAGGVLGHQVGGGRGRDIMTVLGAIGGGLAGHQIEKNARKTSEYQTVVRYENGNTQVFSSTTVPSWRIGDKVKVVNGVIEPND